MYVARDCWYLPSGYGGDQLMGKVLRFPGVSQTELPKRRTEVQCEREVVNLNALPPGASLEGEALVARIFEFFSELAERDHRAINEKNVSLRRTLLKNRSMGDLEKMLKGSTHKQWAALPSYYQAIAEEWFKQYSAGIGSSQKKE
jgi:hypothetical protein